MSSNESDKNVPDLDAYYETVASQEELFLEETEEEVRAILISDESSRSQEGAKNEPRASESTCEQLNHAAEELITGDSDDPPLSEEAVSEMLTATLNSRRIA